MPVLCYHSVCDSWEGPLSVTESRFEEQCRSLARRFRVVDLETAVGAVNRRGRLPARMSTITFDDGFADNYEVALPILRRHRLAATIFVVAATIDGDGQVDWVDDPPPFPLRLLSRDHLRDLADEGVTIASHSLRHKDLTDLTLDECIDDLTASREILEDAIGRRVDYLAYPRGRWNPTVAKAAELAGFTNAFTLPTGPETVGQYSIPRTGIYRDNGTVKFAVKTSRWYAPLRTSRVLQALRR